MGVRWEFLAGKTRQELTFVVKDPDLYKIVTAWPKLDQKLRAIIVSLLEMSRDA